MASRSGLIGVLALLILVPIFATAGAAILDLPTADTDTTGTPGPINEDTLNTTAIELAIHEKINEERTARGLAPLAYRSETAARAEAHSEWMTTTNNGTLNHSTDDHYRCNAAENIAYTYAVIEHVAPDGGVTQNYGNETKIGHDLAAQWMHSPPHRENILAPDAEAEGIGIAVLEQGGKRVYATQGICV